MTHPKRRDSRYLSPCAQFSNFVARSRRSANQLFNATEKRLARAVLLLARYGKEDQPQRVLPKASQGTLAETIGTTRSRLNLFMNKFKKMGFVKYNGGLQINSPLLSVVLHD